MAGRGAAGWSRARDRDGHGGRWRRGARELHRGLLFICLRIHRLGRRRRGRPVSERVDLVIHLRFVPAAAEAFRFLSRFGSRRAGACSDHGAILEVRWLVERGFGVRNGRGEPVEQRLPVPIEVGEQHPGSLRRRAEPRSGGRSGLRAPDADGGQLRQLRPRHGRGGGEHQLHPAPVLAGGLADEGAHHQLHLAAVPGEPALVAGCPARAGDEVLHGELRASERGPAVAQLHVHGLGELGGRHLASGGGLEELLRYGFHLLLELAELLAQLARVGEPGLDALVGELFQRHARPERRGRRRLALLRLRAGGTGIPPRMDISHSSSRSWLSVARTCRRSERYSASSFVSSGASRGGSTGPRARGWRPGPPCPCRWTAPHADGGIEEREREPRDFNLRGRLALGAFQHEAPGDAGALLVQGHGVDTGFHDGHVLPRVSVRER